MKNLLKNLTRITALIVAVYFICMLISCVPLFSDIQSAKMVGKGNFEITPSYSKVGPTSSSYGVQGALGLSEKVDLRMRIEQSDFGFDTGDDFIEGIYGGNETHIGVGPKISIKENHMSFYLPVFMIMVDGEVVGSEIQPTILGTVQLSKYLELNPSAKVLPLYQDMALNLGVGIGDPDKFVFRAEYGRLVTVGLEQFSVGVSIPLTKKE